MNIKRQRFIILIIFMILAGCFTVSTQFVKAISKSSQAKKAYANMMKTLYVDTSLNEKLTDYKFGLIDINKDGVPEIAYTKSDGYKLNIFTYTNGKVTHIADGFSGEQAFYPNKKMYYSISIHGSVYEEYYKFNGMKMVQLAMYKNKDERELEKNAKYYIRGKKVTKRKYQNYVRKLKKGAKETRVKYYRNTSSNRKKYLSGTKRTSTNKTSSYKTYYNGRFDYYVKYPSKFQKYFSPDNGDGAGFRTKNKDAKLSIYGSYNVMDYDGYSAYDAYKNSYEKKSKFSHKAGKNFFSFSYEEGSKHVYRYAFYTVGGVMVGFELKYPKSQKKQYKKVIETMVNSIRKNKCPNPI